jgi:hypothetical protein
MASQYYRLLDAKVLGGADQSPREEVFDAGAFKTLQVQLQVLKQGSNGNIKLTQAATLESDEWVDLGDLVTLSSTTNTLITHSNFLRYVRYEYWAVAGMPIATIDIIAKE